MRHPVTSLAMLWTLNGRFVATMDLVNGMDVVASM